MAARAGRWLESGKFSKGSLKCYLAGWPWGVKNTLLHVLRRKGDRGGPFRLVGDTVLGAVGGCCTVPYKNNNVGYRFNVRA